MDIASDLDFSSFPLLRVDQLKRHELSTLVSSEEELHALISSDTATHDKNGDSLVSFASKLIDNIRREIADRRIQSLLLEQHFELPTTNKGISSLGLQDSKQPTVESERSNAKTSSRSMCRVGSFPEIGRTDVKVTHTKYPVSGRGKNKKSTGLTSSADTQHLCNNQSHTSRPISTSHNVNSNPIVTGNKSSQGKVKSNRKGILNNISTTKSKISSFVVGIGSQDGGGFRGRAKKATDALKTRSLEQSESYKYQRLENQRKERKQQASERMKLRRERRQSMETRRKKRALIAKRKREIEAEEEAKRVRDQMKSAAESAKAKAKISGKSAQEAILDAAAAAADVVQRTASSTQLSDSSESLSDLDESVSDSSLSKETIPSCAPIVTNDAHCLDQHDMIEKQQQHVGSITDAYVPNEEEELNATEAQISSTEHKHDIIRKSDSALSCCKTEDSSNKKLLSSDKHLCLVESDREYGQPLGADNHKNKTHAILLDEREPSSTTYSGAEGDYVTHMSFSSADKSILDLLSSSRNTTPCPSIGYQQKSQADCLSKDSSHKFSEVPLVDFTPIDGESRKSCDASETHILRRTKILPSKTSRCKALTALHNTEHIADRYKFTDLYPSFATLFTRFHQLHTRTGASGTCYSAQVTQASDLRECMFFQRKLISAFLEVMEQASASSSAHEPSNTDTHDVNSSSELGDRFFRVSSSREEVSSILLDSLTQDESASSWKELPPGEGLGTSWNLLWTWSRPKLDYDSLLIFQKINHFRNVRGLTRKDLLKKNLQRFCLSANHHTGGGNQINNASKLMPLTYVLPQEYNTFIAAFLSIQKIAGNLSSNFWIMKPVGLSRGRGISVVNSIEDVSYADPIVIQKYLLNPLLYLGYKFDLRLYILVTSFNPLEAFIYRQGFGRFGSKKFSTNPESINDVRVHLTNSSIQQQYWDDLDPTHPVILAGMDGGGNKVALSWLFKKLGDQGVDIRKMWKRISDLCLKTLLCVEDGIPYQPNAFEVFGFDVMFDEQLSPWLIEVNSSPALSRETDLDARIKEGMIYDTITLLDPPAFDREALLEICERRCSQQCKDRGKRPPQKNISERDQLEKDLREILLNKLPRRYGEMPGEDFKGDYERLAPGTPSFERLKKAHPSYNTQR